MATSDQYVMVAEHPLTADLIRSSVVLRLEAAQWADAERVLLRMTSFSNHSRSSGMPPFFSRGKLANGIRFALRPGLLTFDSSKATDDLSLVLTVLDLLEEVHPKSMSISWSLYFSVEHPNRFLLSLIASPSKFTLNDVEPSVPRIELEYNFDGIGVDVLVGKSSMTSSDFADKLRIKVSVTPKVGNFNTNYKSFVKSWSDHRDFAFRAANHLFGFVR